MAASLVVMTNTHLKMVERTERKRSVAWRVLDGRTVVAEFEGGSKGLRKATSYVRQAQGW